MKKARDPVDNLWKTQGKLGEKRVGLCDEAPVEKDYRAIVRDGEKNGKGGLMHYFNMNIGDYAKKAGRLSMLEHGAYTLLIHACYDREEFPTRDEAVDWCWARTAEEVAAVDFVLGKFFVLQEDEKKRKVYVQKRVEEEISKYREKAKTNKKIAVNRWKEAKKEKVPTAYESHTKRIRTVPEQIENSCDSCTNIQKNDASAYPTNKPITNNQETKNQKPKKEAGKGAFPTSHTPLYPPTPHSPQSEKKEETPSTVVSIYNDPEYRKEKAPAPSSLQDVLQAVERHDPPTPPSVGRVVDDYELLKEKTGVVDLEPRSKAYPGNKNSGANTGNNGSGIPCPYEEIKNIFNRVMVNNPSVMVLTEKRKAEMRMWWDLGAAGHLKFFEYSTVEDGLKSWNEFFTLCNKIPFLTGKGKKNKKHPTPFMPDFNWFFSGENIENILNEKYSAEYRDE